MWENSHFCQAIQRMWKLSSFLQVFFSPGNISLFSSPQSFNGSLCPLEVDFHYNMSLWLFYHSVQISMTNIFILLASIVRWMQGSTSTVIWSSLATWNWPGMDHPAVLPAKTQKEACFQNLIPLFDFSGVVLNYVCIEKHWNFLRNLIALNRCRPIQLLKGAQNFLSCQSC